MRFTMTSLAAFTLAAVANADPTGAWAFETVIEDKGTTIFGTMTIQYPKDGHRECSFVSTEVAFGETDGVTIDQSCTVTEQVGGTLLIRSVVEQSLTEGYSIANYFPDHFTVRPKGSDRMVGTWYDANFSAPVVFWREKAPPVS